MSTEQTETNATETQLSLDDFAAELFGGSKDKPSDNAKSEDVQVEVEVESDAPEEDGTEEEATQTEFAEDDEDLGDEPDNDAEEASDSKGQTRYQKRINELTAARREAERLAQERERELLEKVQELEALKQKNKETDPQPDNGPDQATGLREPKPDDKNEDGTDKYPLGMYDPNYMRDNMEYMFSAKEQERLQREAQAREAREADQARASLQASWNAKLVDAQERYPDFQQKGEQMISVFEGIDPAYGQYLTDTIMDLDAGPDVFYYLANNIEEAQQIVSAGPRKATIAIAKLEAQLAGTPKPQGTKIKPSQAPEPPPRLKGSSVAKSSEDIDMNDLDAFSKVLFSKKK